MARAKDAPGPPPRRFRSISGTICVAGIGPRKLFAAGAARAPCNSCRRLRSRILTPGGSDQMSAVASGTTAITARIGNVPATTNVTVP